MELRGGKREESGAGQDIWAELITGSYQVLKLVGSNGERWRHDARRMGVTGERRREEIRTGTTERKHTWRYVKQNLQGWTQLRNFYELPYIEDETV